MEKENTYLSLGEKTQTMHCNFILVDLGLDIQNEEKKSLFI